MFKPLAKNLLNQDMSHGHYFMNTYYYYKG